LKDKEKNEQRRKETGNELRRPEVTGERNKKMKIGKAENKNCKMREKGNSIKERGDSM
jgi:hypothetical protein